VERLRFASRDRRNSGDPDRGISLISFWSGWRKKPAESPIKIGTIGEPTIRKLGKPIKKVCADHFSIRSDYWRCWISMRLALEINGLARVAASRLSLYDKIWEFCLITHHQLVNNPRIYREADALAFDGHEVRVLTVSQVPSMTPRTVRMPKGRPWNSGKP